ncbi:MAG: DUF883 domain-containing protein [Verrucomicrobiota bacterium]
MDASRENSAENAARVTGRAVGEAAASAAQRVGESFEQSKESLAEMQSALAERTRECMHTTDAYVRDNPWQAVGVAAGLGLILGLLLARK